MGKFCSRLILGNLFIGVAGGRGRMKVRYMMGVGGLWGRLGPPKDVNLIYERSLRISTYLNAQFSSGG